MIGRTKRKRGEANALRVALLILALASAAGDGPLAEGQWRSAEPGRRVSLPADHASHPDYRLEWWYYTGNVDARDGRRFGYQLTFFRVGVDPQPVGTSRWAVRDLFMTHLAITDVTRNRHEFKERLNRSGPGWAGASVDSYHVWNEDWTAFLQAPGIHRLKAIDTEIGVDLTLHEDRPPALNGEDGYSQKGDEPGNASFYYSVTRMTTAGSLWIHGERIDVSGLSWMDHEFGTNFLEKRQRGWDWLGLQLNDGSDLMLYQLRQRDGTVDPHSSGTLVDDKGHRTPIRVGSGASRGLHGFSLEPGRAWRSPATSAAYPVSWVLKIPDLSAELHVTAVVDGQELATGKSTGVAYWEGAVDVSGTIRGQTVEGRGYLEMTGYAGPPVGPSFPQDAPVPAGRAPDAR